MFRRINSFKDFTSLAYLFSYTISALIGLIQCSLTRFFNVRYHLQLNRLGNVMNWISNHAKSFETILFYFFKNEVRRSEESTFSYNSKTRE